jgi:hypothetical protein
MVQEPEHILEVLKEAKEAVKNEDLIRLKSLSNQTIHSASIHQDADCILVAIIIYSLSKIIERTNYREYPSWNSFFKQFMKHIDYAIICLEKNNIEDFREELGRIRTSINNLTGSFKKHIQDVFRKASINKASRIYEHGISMEKTSRLLGISLWELAEYAGQTGIGDVNFNITLPVKKRIKLAEDIFR